MNKIAIFCTTLILAASSMMAAAHPGINHCLRQPLELTQQQRQQLAQIREQKAQQLQAYRQQHQAYLRELGKLVRQTHFDEEALRQLWLQNQAMFLEAALARARARQQIYQLLTDRQREQWQQCRKGRRALAVD